MIAESICEGGKIPQFNMRATKNRSLLLRQSGRDCEYWTRSRDVRRVPRKLLGNGVDTCRPNCNRRLAFDNETLFCIGSSPYSQNVGTETLITVNHGLLFDTTECRVPCQQIAQKCREFKFAGLSVELNMAIRT